MGPGARPRGVWVGIPEARRDSGTHFGPVLVVAAAAAVVVITTAAVVVVTAVVVAAVVVAAAVAQSRWPLTVYLDLRTSPPQCARKTPRWS